jgi:3-phosphoshikimate 1-carboxyvinyltransferase
MNGERISPIMKAKRSLSAANAHPAPKPLRSSKAEGLTGRLRPPGDKSVSHRALIFGLLTVGETTIEGLLEGEDVLRTADACRALGATVTRRGDGAWSVRGLGIGTVLQPRETLDFGNAGTGSRLMMGVVGGHPITARFDGDASLRKRPMRRILDPLLLQGARVLEEAEGGRLPLLLQGTAEPLPIVYTTPVASAQVKSAVLLAGLNAPGRTTVIENEASRDHTEKMLLHFGARLKVEPHGAHGRRITLEGRPELIPRHVRVPADPSSAAFPLAAALIIPGSDVLIEGVMTNPLRSGLVTTLREMGADIALENLRNEGGEDVADIRARYSPALRGVEVPAARAPAMIDEYPILAVVAAFAAGETRMRGLSELRVKESDRLAAIAAGLAANGVDCAIEGDDLFVRGGAGVRGGGVVETHLDHRIAMSFLVLGLAAENAVGVDDCGMIATSFPSFRALMTELGAQFSE